MSKLPLQEKNAFLKVLVTTHGIYSHLAYSHYDIGRFYVINDFTELAVFGSEDDSFWKEYFFALEKTLGWELLTQENEITQRREFREEGNGVSGIVVIFDWNVPDKDRYLSTLREFCHDIQIKLMGESEYSSLYNSLARKFNYHDILVADINFDGISVSRFKKVPDTERSLLIDTVSSEASDGVGNADRSLGDTSFSKVVSKFGGYKYETIFRERPEAELLLDLLKNQKLTALLTEEVSGDKVRNAWINFVLSNRSYTEEPVVKDIMRAYFTLQLLSLSNINTEFFQKFGVQKYSEPPVLTGTALILTGNATELLSRQDILVSVLDGLQLKGSFDLFFDSKKLIVTFGSNAVLGINASEMIVPKEVVFEEILKIVVPEVPKDKQPRKVVFRGSITNANTGNTSVFGLAPQMVYLDVPNGKSIIELEFDKGAYVKDTGSSANIISDPSAINYNGIVIDCRYKPTVYGPDAKTNKVRMSEWKS